MGRIHAAGENNASERERNGALTHSLSLSWPGTTHAINKWMNAARL